MILISENLAYSIQEGTQPSVSIMKETKLEKLYKKFKNLTPQERNDRLQAIYAAKLEEMSLRKLVKVDALDLFKTLTKSFELSIKFETIAGDPDDDAF